ncbi:MAG: hypothetical protein H7829_04830 [Magnetococcus sp. THC-1_WYH]
MTLFLTFLLTLLFHAPLIPKHFFSRFWFSRKKMRRARALVCLFSRFLRKKANTMQCLSTNLGIMLDVFRKRREKHQAKARACAFFPLKEEAREKCFGIKGAWKSKVKSKIKSKIKSKVKTLGAIPQTPFFF